MITWSIIKNQIDNQGAFTQLIKWNPPNSSGYIVQYVRVEDPMQLLSGYNQPYYEAWRIEDGKVTYDYSSEEEYDDSFSNCYNGFSFAVEIAKENVEREMKSNNIKETYITYHCIVYFVQDGSLGANEINDWKRGEELGIQMAGKLKASYIAPNNLGLGTEREFKASFYL